MEAVVEKTQRDRNVNRPAVGMIKGGRLGMTTSTELQRIEFPCTACLVSL